MKKKESTGLAAFTNKKTDEAQEKVETPRTRGKGPTVTLTVRLTRPDWERLHQLAVAEGVSINRLAIVGFSRLFGEKGLPPLGGLTDS